MKKNLVVLLALTLVISTVACSNNTENEIQSINDKETEEAEARVTSAIEATAEVNETSAIETTAEVDDSEEADTPSTEQYDDSEQMEVFADLLMSAYEEGTLPDGTVLDYLSKEEAEKNTFAIVDVDGDGKDELILYWGNACMAGMVGYVFGYDDGEVYEELIEFPMMTFYDNGCARADWSHNQGLAGDFWPYNFYEYDESSDKYERVASVDAWDKDYYPEDYEGNAFPEEIDVDGDGIIYYVCPGEWSGEYDDEYIDGEMYDSWINAQIDCAEVIAIPEQQLTENNIEALR